MPASVSNFLLLLLTLVAGLVATAAPDTEGDPDLVHAEALFRERRYAESQAAFEVILAREPENRRALLHLGKLAAKRHERALAVDLLGRAVALAPDDAELQFEYGAASSLYAATLGTSFKALGAVRRGRAAMERAVALAPDQLTYRQGLLEFYAEAPGIAGGSMAKAYAQADAIAARDPAQGAYAKANLQRLEKNLRGALDTLNDALQLDPDNYFVLFQYGRCAAESGLDLDRGLAALKRCLELPAPDQGAPPAQVWWRIAQVHEHRGHTDAAREALQQAASLAPGDSRIAEALARLTPGTPS